MKRAVHISQKSDIYFQLVYPKIIETLRLAAAEPEIQIKVFPETESPPEEIGFLVEHATMMANVLYENNRIKKWQLDSINKLNQKFNCFDKSEWKIDSMYDSMNWNDSRTLALRTLQEFSVDKAAPNLYWYHGNKNTGDG